MNNKWKEGFTGKVEALRDKWRQKFDVLASETLEPVFDELTEFVQQWDFQGSAPQTQSAVRTFKFALAENAYVLVFFRSKGLDAVQWLYECALPGEGTVKSRVSDAHVTEVTKEWATECFQTALDEFVAKLNEVECTQEIAEPALA